MVRPRRLIAALLVGVATLFDRKPERDRHWAVPPTWPVDDEGETPDSGSGER